MFKLHNLKSFFFPTFYFGPEAAVVAPELVEGATVTGGMTEAEIAAQKLLAEQQAAAALQAQQATEAAQATQQATNEAIRNTVTQTPVSPPGTGGISNLVNTTGGPTTFEQIFSQGQNIADNSTELGKLANARQASGIYNLGVSNMGAGPVSLTDIPIEYNQPFPAPPSLPASAIPPVEPVAPPPVAAPPVAPPPVAAPPVTEPVPVAETAPVKPPTPLNQIMKAPPPNTFVGLAGSPAGTTLGTGADAGIKALANEVMPGVQSTVSGYGAGAPAGSSVLPPSTGGPAPSINQLAQTNLSGMGTNLTSAEATLPSPAQGLQARDFVGNSTEGLKQRAAGTYTGLQTPTNPINYNVPELPSRLGYGLADKATEVSATNPIAPREENGIKGLFNQGLDWVKKNPLSAAMGANALVSYLNAPKPYQPEKYKSTWHGGNYQGYNPVQPTPYRPNYAAGGLADLGGYSDGGHMLKGPGDGMSDDIPATIANKQPARLANEEFVIPADVVSHLGNGSSEAGAKQLYKMMDRVRQARTGTKKQGKQIKPEKYLA